MGINNFSFYILEIIEKPELESFSSKEFLSIRENYWHSIINPSYNIQTILNPFSGINHYRFGKKLSAALLIRIKISCEASLKGRIQSQSRLGSFATVPAPAVAKLPSRDWDGTGLKQKKQIIS